MCARCSRCPSTTFIPSSVVSQFPGTPELQPVHVDRVGKSEVVDRAGQRTGNLPGRHVEMIHPLVPGAQPPLALLPLLHAPGIHDLDPVSPGRLEQPGHGLAQALGVARRGPDP